jgi:FlaA1/EpsC-like NDP-sugar epimerase
LDQAENPLFRLERELNQSEDAPQIFPLLGSVVDRLRMAQIIRQYKPDVIFHAAAHKHVPLMEANPSQAIVNNVVGSRRLAELADEMGVEVFVMISTDKAVNPSSVMGASKRLAEMYIQALSRRSKTRFLTVRFGNVLGSEGSVVQIFKEQIAAGGPVTVTHPEMKRYFMTIPEASQLVLQAGTMGEGGEIFILEMGEPIPIVNLARDLIRLSGYRPGEEIPIQFSGVRPGEKLYEEINLSEENATKTKHPRIWIGNSTQTSMEQLAHGINSLQKLSETASPDEVRSALADWVPEYRPIDSAGNTPSVLIESPQEKPEKNYRTATTEPLTVTH